MRDRTKLEKFFTKEFLKSASELCGNGSFSKAKLHVLKSVLTDI